MRKLKIFKSENVRYYEKLSSFWAVLVIFGLSMELNDTNEHKLLSYNFMKSFSLKMIGLLMENM